MKCRDDSYFDSTNHTCKSNDMAPTIERMLMNIFGILWYYIEKWLNIILYCSIISKNTEIMIIIW